MLPRLDESTLRRTGSPKEVRPVQEQEIDIELAREVLAVLCQAVGNHDRMSAATARLVAAAGMPDPNDDYAVMEAVRREGPGSTTKNWRWLVAVAKHANQTGAHDVAAMAYFWASVWIHKVEPTFPPGPGAFFEVGFDKAPPGVYVTLVREAQVALENLPEGHVVAVTSEPATITCDTLVPIVAEQVKAGGDISPYEAEKRLIDQLG